MFTLPRIYRTLSVAIVGIAAAASVPSAAPSAALRYRGFRCDLSGLTAAVNADQMEAALREQIDIVCAVGLTPRVLDYFRTIRITAVPGGRGNPALYRADHVVRVNSAMIAFRHRPVLLHEFMHAFHQGLLQDGVRNAEVRTFYERAKEKHAYAADSHMLSNVFEFFACSSTTYLAGATAQEPFTRQKLRASQPRFYAYLQALFGLDAGRYDGKATAVGLTGGSNPKS